MKFDGVILYGPPASGKDAVTAELCSLSSTYTYFEKLKVGAGRTRGYRMITEESLASLRDSGNLIHEIERYGAKYAIDGPGLDALFGDGRAPIVHMGQVAGVDAVHEYRAHWLDVLLWCSKDVAEARLRQRGSADINDRLIAWRATLADLGSFAEPRFTLSVRTDVVTPAAAAALIHAAMTSQ